MPPRPLHARVRPLIALVGVAAGVLAAGITGTARGADDPQLVRRNEDGIAALLDGRAERAVEQFEQALAQAPGNQVLERNLAAALARVAENRRRDRRYDVAIRLLDRALRLHPTRIRYRVLLGRIRFEEGTGANRQLAREDFAIALRSDPDYLDALVNMGQLEYIDRRLEHAVEVWRRAMELRPDDSDVKARLAKAVRELTIEREFEEIPAPRFKLRYAPMIPRDRAEAVLRICEEAYGELSKSYDSHPEGIAVTLYTPTQFRSATNLHRWVAGLSDGTIRLTVQERTPLASLRATIYHELAHHLIRERTAHAPVWLHEGLAQRAEGKNAAAAIARLKRGARPEPRDLAEDILRQPDARLVSRFYDLALAFTQFLYERQGDRGIYLLLSGLDRPDATGKVLETVYGQDFAALFAEWRDRTLR